MHRYRRASSSEESEFSETDVSIDNPRRRTHVRQRSLSRHRYSPSEPNNFLRPDVIIHRSASTGGRRPTRRAEREREREPPTVYVDINNDVRSDVRSRNTSRNRRVNNRVYGELDESDDEIPRLYRRPRAGSSTSRHSSPQRSNFPQPARDYELMIDQRLLERNDARQDLELIKQQQEIKRLEQELARRRGHETRLLKQEEEWYEDEISEKLRKLEKLEAKKRIEEERRYAEWREKVKKLEEMERKKAEEEVAKARLREEQLKELEKKEKERKEKERLLKEIKAEEAQKLLEEKERQEEEEKLRREAIAEYKRKEEQRIMREQKEKEEKDKEFRERLRKEFGCTEEQLDDILNHRERERERERERGREIIRESDLIRERESDMIRERECYDHYPTGRTTYIKVRKEGTYLTPDD